MAEKRTADIVLLLKIQGKRRSNKLEMFNMKQWEPNNHMGNKFRLRLNGKWFPKDKKIFFTKTEIKEMVFKDM